MVRLAHWGMPVIRQLGTRSLSGGLIRERDSMRYLVHRGTGTIIDPLDDVVIVDIDDDNLEEEDILELANNADPTNKAVFMRASEVVAGVSDEDIVDMLSYNLDNGHYAYCNANPGTWPAIRSRIMNTDSLFIEFNETFNDAVY